MHDNHADTNGVEPQGPTLDAIHKGRVVLVSDGRVVGVVDSVAEARWYADGQKLNDPDAGPLQILIPQPTADTSSPEDDVTTAD